MHNLAMVIGLSVLAYAWVRVTYRLKVGENRKRIWFGYCIFVDAGMLIFDVIVGNWPGAIVMLCWLLYSIYQWWKNGGDKGLKNLIKKGKAFLKSLAPKPVMVPAFGLR